MVVEQLGLNGLDLRRTFAFHGLIDTQTQGPARIEPMQTADLLYQIHWRRLSRWQRLLDQSVARLLPPTCVLCGAPGYRDLDLCAGCLADLPYNSHACTRCALPLPWDLQTAGVCDACQRRPPPQDASYVPFLYQDTIPTLVVGAKFHGRLNLARLLGLCLARSLRQEGISRPDILIPVPLYPQRMRERGYNQALEIARPLSRELSIPVDTRVCVRLRATPPQVGLEREERQHNVRGAFGIVGPVAARHVAILDDVITTGGTAGEIARVLRQAGAARIDLWAVARTP
ncbi:MAG: ComF family protein [Chromatiaceae bacterium]